MKISYKTIARKSKPLRDLMIKIFPSNTFLKRLALQETYLNDYISSFYDNKSIEKKLFYNIGAGNQRSSFDIWKYIDLKSSKYSKDNIDVFYDLESLEPIPIDSNHAEVIFNSFVIEHISIDATKNLCREAFRILKQGGVFHSKVHCYDYSYQLLQKGLISPKIPFECRESRELLNTFILKHKGKIKAYFNDQKEYIIESISEPKDNIIFNPLNSFLYYNATSAVNNYHELKKELVSDTVLETLKSGNIKAFYKKVKDHYVIKHLKEPHQHNADYFSQHELYEYIKSLGFSEVYFTQPFQSVSPVLWEDKLNPIHKGFLFSIEAVK